MSDMRRWKRLVHIPLARRVPRDVDAELRFHLEERIEELMETRGLSREEATREAESRFGDVGRVRAEVEAIDRAGHRRRSLGEWADALARDVRTGARALRRSPGFTATAVLTLALAIGANTAIFSAVNAVLLRPLPTAALDRLTVIRGDIPALDMQDTQLGPPTAEELLARRDVFDRATAYAGRQATLEEMGEPRQLRVTRSLGDFFGTFEVRPVVGRGYRPDESREGDHRVAVLGWSFWQEVYGGDARVVGRTLTMDSVRYEIVGVMPRDFRHPRGTDVYVPFAMTAAAREPAARGRLMMTLVARLRPEVGEQQLARALDDESRRIAASYPGSDPTRPFRLTATPLVEVLAGQLRPVLAVLMGAVVLVLLIACANVASLQLVRAAGRAREVAVRAALGARRGGIVRQLLVESLLLAAAGGALGVLVGWWITAFLARQAPAQFPQLEGLALDPRVLAFTAAVATGAGLAFGLLPALRASRADLNGVLKAQAGRGASAGRGQQRLLSGSVVVQVALTLVLLLGSALVLRSLGGLLAVDPGFAADRVVTMRVTLPGARYPRDQAGAFYDRLVDRVQSLPGVAAAGVVFGLPFGGGHDSSPFEVPGMTYADDAPKRHAEYRVIEGEFLRALGIRLLQGRAFTDADASGSENVVLIDESLARQFFPGVDPVGRTIRQNGSINGDTWRIVGVVRGVMRNDVGEPIKPTIYYHLPQMGGFRSLSLAVRTTGDESTLRDAVRAAVRAMEPQALVTEVRTMREHVDRSLGARRLATWVLAAFASLALALALLGIYGVVSYGMAQRRQEIGIRMALGATATDVLRMVLRQAATLAGAGLAIGVVAFLALGRTMDALLYGVTSRDPATLALVTGVVVAVSLAAAAVPGWRAGRAGTAEVLRG